jgi:hypothetical protein
LFAARPAIPPTMSQTAIPTLSQSLLRDAFANGMPLDVLVGEVDEDRDLVFLCGKIGGGASSQCRKKRCDRMTSWVFSLPMTEKSSPIRWKNIVSGIIPTSTGILNRAAPRATQSCSPSLASGTKRCLAHAADTDWYGSFGCKRC